MRLSFFLIRFFFSRIFFIVTYLCLCFCAVCRALECTFHVYIDVEVVLFFILVRRLISPCIQNISEAEMRYSSAFGIFPIFLFTVLFSFPWVYSLHSTLKAFAMCELWIATMRIFRTWFISMMITAYPSPPRPNEKKWLFLIALQAAHCHAGDLYSVFMRIVDFSFYSLCDFAVGFQFSFF